MVVGGTTDMTRINCVPVEELSDQHLIAEYRELPRVFNLVKAFEKRSQGSKMVVLPDKYCLGTGHVLFFYNKLSFLIKRQMQLVDEMVFRGFVPNFDPLDLWHHHVKAGGWISDWYWNDWGPTQEALELNRQRIKERTTFNMKNSRGDRHGTQRQGS